MSTKIIILTVVAVAYFLWKLRSKTDEDDTVAKNHGSSINAARSTVLQLRHCDRRESLNAITTNNASAEEESESTRLRRSQSNESRREREEYPQIIKRSTSSSEKGGNVNKASCSSTAATRSDIPVSIPNLASERRYFSDVVKEPNQAQENENQQIISRSTQKAAKTIPPNRSQMINDIHPYRKEASEHWEKILEYESKASISEKKFADECRKLAEAEREKMKEANRKAVQLFLEKGSPGFPHCLTLDLHHLYIKEAKPIVDRFLQINMKRRDKVFIITGKGNHSKGPRSTLRDWIMEYLSEKEHRFKEDA